MSLIANNLWREIENRGNAGAIFRQRCMEIREKSARIAVPGLLTGSYLRFVSIRITPLVPREP